MNCFVTKKAHLITLFLLLFTVYGIAQIQDCSVDIFEDEALLHSSQQHRANLEFESKYQDFIMSGKKLNLEDGMFAGLPIVFHIIHEGDSLGSVSNPRYEQIFELIEKTNNYFRQLNEEQNTFENPFYGADTEISFCLANRDENGDPSSGIIRYANSNIGNTYLLDLLWDTKRYINVFYINDIAPGICGTYSSGSDIIRVVNRCVTKSILAHELGHYLDLKHTFLMDEDCSNEDCTKQGDLVCDTPPKFASTTTALEGFEGQPCLYPANTCHTDEDDVSANNPYRSVALGGMGDQADPNSNIMGYANTCRNNFTQGQAIRMQMNLLEKRQELWMQETQCEPNFILDNDAVIDRVSVTNLNECKPDVEVNIRLENIGTNTLESAKIQAYQNGELVATKNWTGSLETGEAELLSLEEVISFPGRNEIMIQIVELNNDSVGVFQSSSIFATFDLLNSSFDFDFFMQDKIVCNRESVVLGTTHSDPLTNLNFIWRRKNGTIEDDIRKSSSLTVSESDTYYLTVYDDDYTCSISYEADIFFVNSALDKPLGISSNKNRLDCGSSFTFLTVSNLPPSAQVNWYREDTKIEEGDIIFVTEPGNYRYEAVYKTEECEAFSDFSPWFPLLGHKSLPTFSLQQIGEIGCSGEKVSLVPTNFLENKDRYDFQWNATFGLIRKISVNLNPETHPSFFENGDPTILLTNTFGTYSLTVTDKLTSCKFTKAIRVESENDSPNVSVIFDFTPRFNNDDAYTLDAIVSEGSYEFEWTSQGGSIIAGATTLTPTIQGYGTYMFKITDLDSGCELTQTYPLFPSTAIHFDSNCNAVSANDDFLFSAYIARNSDFPVTIKWYDEAGNLLNNNWDVFLDEPGDYMVEIENGSYAELKEFYVDENVFSRPLSFIHSVDSLICPGESTILSGSSSIIPENSILIWRNSQGHEIGNNPIIDNVMEGAYSLEIANLDNGCFSFGNIFMEEEQITADAGDYKILDCPNTEVSLGANVMEDDFEFTWRQINAEDTMIVSNESTLVTDQAGTYILELNNENGTCTVVDEVVVYEEEEFIRVENISLDKCNSLSALLSVKNLDNYFDYDLIWTLPDGTESVLPILRITEEGTYTLRFFDHRNGCEKRDTFIFASSLSIAIAQSEIGLTVETQGGVPPYTYLWSDGSVARGIGDLISGTNYRVTVTDSNACQAVEEFTYIGSITNRSKEILISPNPSDGIVSIEFEEDTLTDLNLVVFGMSGQEIFTKKYLVVQNNVQFDMELFPGGVYVFQININGKVTHHKVVLMK